MTRVQSLGVVLGTVVIGIAIGVTATAGLSARGQEAASPRAAGPTLTTPYQAVFLDNGQAYFGRLEGLGTDYPVLTDVYYIQTRINQATKETSNALLKRGTEWHGPDRMILNAEHIILVEPVSPGSKIMTLITESKAGNAAAPAPASGAPAAAK